MEEKDGVEVGVSCRPTHKKYRLLDITAKWPAINIWSIWGMDIFFNGIPVLKSIVAVNVVVWVVMWVLMRWL